MMKRFLVAITCVCIAATFTVRAHIELPALFSDNMVLQQGVPVTIWGWGHDGEQVTVSFRGQKVSTKVQNLKWSVKLRALKAGGPDTLTIATDDDKLQFNNVLVGEVWICSGQSNMEWPLSAAFEPQADIDSATNEL